jgi:hypothetical protein
MTGGQFVLKSSIGHDSATALPTKTIDGQSILQVFLGLPDRLIRASGCDPPLSVYLKPTHLEQVMPMLTILLAKKPQPSILVVDYLGYLASRAELGTPAGTLTKENRVVLLHRLFSQIIARLSGWSCAAVICEEERLIERLGLRRRLEMELAHDSEGRPENDRAVERSPQKKPHQSGSLSKTLR